MMPLPVGRDAAADDDPHGIGMLRPSGPPTVALSPRQSNILENRDLCRIISSYIPTTIIRDGN